MRTTLLCSVLSVVLALVLAESSSSSAAAQAKQHQQQASIEQKSAEDKSDHDAVAQPATSYSSVVYHDPPHADGGGGGGGGGSEGSHSATRVTKAAALGDIAAAGAESSASFRLYHPKLEDYMSNMNPSLVHNLMKQQPQTFAKIEQHKSESGPVAQAATKLLYPPKKYKSVVPGSQQTAFNVGYSIGFGGGGGGGGGSSDGGGGGGGGGSRQPHPQALVGHEEVVTGKPKLRVRVEGKNSVWKQLSPNVEMSSQSTSPSSYAPLRYAFDHDQALGQSNTFDASNAVEDPLQLHQLPLAMPLTFPLPLTAFDNMFIPPQTSSPQRPLAVAAPGQFRTGHALQLKQPSDSPVDAKPLASLHSVHTLLPQENMFHQATGSLQTADGLTLPAMQHVLVTGSDGQMVPAYLIPVAALGAAQPLPRHPHPHSVSSFFPHHRPSPSPPSSQRDSYDHHRHERNHHNHQKQSQNLVASAASPHPERLKPFRPSQPLGPDGFTISTNPHTHASHHHAHRQRPLYVTRSVVTEGGGGGGGGGFKAVESGDQRQVPSSMYVLKPPAPEKAASSEPSFSYQMYDHSPSQPQSSPPQTQPQPPKYRTIVQLRPVQSGGVGGVVSGLLPGLRPSRDLAGEQTVLNAILSQELLRKNSAARNAPIIAQTVYGVRSYR